MNIINPYKYQEQDEVAYHAGYTRKSELENLKQYYEKLVHNLREELDDAHTKASTYKRFC